MNKLMRTFWGRLVYYGAIAIIPIGIVYLADLGGYGYVMLITLMLIVILSTELSEYRLRRDRGKSLQALGVLPQLGQEVIVMDKFDRLSRLSFATLIKGDAGIVSGLRGFPGEIQVELRRKGAISTTCGWYYLDELGWPT